MFKQKIVKTYEIYLCFIALEIFGHIDYLVPDFFPVRAVLCNNIAHTAVQLFLRQIQKLSLAQAFLCFFGRYRILPCKQNAVYTANGVGMSLTDSPAPERVRPAGGHYAFHIYTRERKKTGIPADAYHRRFSAHHGGFIHVFKMLRNFCVGIKRINNIEIRCNERRCFRKVVRTSGAVEHNVNLFGKQFNQFKGENADVFPGANRFGAAAAEHADKLITLRFKNSLRRRLSEVSVSRNSNFHKSYTSMDI